MDSAGPKDSSGPNSSPNSGRDPRGLRRAQFLTLYRVFLTRVVDLELLSKDADTTRLVAQFMTVFAGISFMLTAPVLLVGGGLGRTVAWTPEHFFIATTLLAVGGVSVMSWDAALPDVVPVLAVVAGSFLVAYPREPVLLHLVLLLTLGMLTVEICLATFPKVPFTCSYLPGKANIHFVFWVGLALTIFLLRKVLEFEERLLQSPLRFGLLVGTLTVLAVGLALFTEFRSRATGVLVFEEAYGEEIVTLNLR